MVVVVTGLPGVGWFVFLGRVVGTRVCFRVLRVQDGPVGSPRRFTKVRVLASVIEAVGWKDGRAVKANVAFFRLSVFLVPESLVEGGLRNFQHVVVRVFRVPNADFTPSLRYQVRFFRPFAGNVRARCASRRRNETYERDEESLRCLKVILGRSFNCPPILPRARENRVSPVSLNVFPRRHRSFTSVFSRDNRDSNLVHFLRGVGRYLVVLFQLGPSKAISYVVASVRQFVPFE